ncbi:MAG TPA: asparagine synthase (glutamine-hydrolyzing) [Tepidisphaeraceae bacterium]|jgi:asparagine synthase (glutamine-hydrolysing)|nr:asparagine synthase (glutamine-hydrolyzing) [Tepidisphaeraceae bacterium]
MCGIAGVVAWDERYRVDRRTIARMGDVIAHRGPDGQDIWMGEQCSLAFARLAILDLDPRAMQPMTDAKRWLVFNGEIYNFRELRAELEQLSPGYRWKTTGDSEVILRAYDAWGEACVEKFNGMFALAIWEPQTGGIFLARDRMGQKPLYFSVRSGGGLAFASELAALRAVPWIKWETDTASVDEYLQTGYIAAPATIYRDVAKLSPGCWMRCGADGSIGSQRYFDPNDFTKGAPATAAEVKSAVLGAVRRQLVSDVPLGCFLSGGIDSSVIAAAMKAVAGQQPILSFSIGFDDPRYDETQYAAAVAAHLGTEHRTLTVHVDAAEDLPKLAKVFGEPFGDSSALPTHYLSRETRRHVKVALSGDGGDELFGGYDRYRAMRLGGAGSTIPRILRTMAAAIPGTHPKSTIARARRFLAAMGLPDAQRYAAYVALFDSDSREALYPQQSLRPRKVVADIYEMLRRGRDRVQAALATDRATYLPEDLLTKLDRASMLHALEVRSPLMDHELVQMAAGFSTAQLLKGGPKRMLREAFAADLPDFVFQRKKMGFAVPIGQWLRQSLRPMMEDLLAAGDSFASGHFQTNVWREMIDEHCGGRVDHSQRLYALVMLELWWRNHLRG